MRAQLPFELDYFSSKERSLIAQACPPEKEASEHGVRELCRRFTGGIIAATKFEVATGLLGLVPLITSRRSITQTRRRRPFRPSPMSLHVISLFLASPARQGLSVRGSRLGEEAMRAPRSHALRDEAPQKDGLSAPQTPVRRSEPH